MASAVLRFRSHCFALQNALRRAPISSTPVLNNSSKNRLVNKSVEIPAFEHHKVQSAVVTPAVKNAAEKLHTPPTRFQGSPSAVSQLERKAICVLVKSDAKIAWRCSGNGTRGESQGIWRYDNQGSFI